MQLYIFGNGGISMVNVNVFISGLPFWVQKSSSFTAFLTFVGYWIFINLTFNFYKVATTPPGSPNDPERLLKSTVAICKKCISPKPPRTHHCSICNQ